ncbi:hypothetical protein O7634_22180 [Micromonospora sp. WMMD1120]|uniref:hypothetical protein n=1 Tax=Micromonospora sp. WMMD1120 TaxID=3016106 RepID=UPI002417F52C|nr:hypothetical protein [Micromonospora sp. WMMD1120]MDG4809464.1 hypothetical protein [Micromonospora sp. WMMD1120]
MPASAMAPPAPCAVAEIAAYAPLNWMSVIWRIPSEVMLWVVLVHLFARCRAASPATRRPAPAATPPITLPTPDTSNDCVSRPPMRRPRAIWASWVARSTPKPMTTSAASSVIRVRRIAYRMPRAVATTIGMNRAPKRVASSQAMDAANTTNWTMIVTLVFWMSAAAFIEVLASSSVTLARASRTAGRSERTRSVYVVAADPVIASPRERASPGMSSRSARRTSPWSLHIRCMLRSIASLPSGHSMPTTTFSSR